jgi:Carboxypeptidase regulatory-like domain
MQQFHPAIKRLAFYVRALSVVLLFLVASIGSAQVAGTGTIQGSITDPTGAVIPGAAITISNVSTNVKHTLSSDSAGEYVFPNIDPGTYNVTVAFPGFETYVKTGNVLEVGSNIAVNIALTVGSQDQKVEVKAEGLALQTEDVSFKQTIDQQDVTEIPLNSNARQITGLLSLSGGSAPAPGADFTGSKYSYQTISVSIAGGNGNTTMWRLDGGDNNDYMSNGNAPFPFPDAVAQFSVESTALGAQDGMHSGGLVNVVTRSGTNKYHGSAFEFIRNNFIDATNFGVIPPNGPGSGKDTLHQNEYGGTFGGPVIIPHVFNGKDKLFFFAGYQFLESKSGTGATTSHVPTAANLAGDFSVTDPVSSAGISPTSCLTKPIQLNDPLTGLPVPGNKYAVAPTWNTAALALQKYLPAINPAVDPNGCGVVQYVIPLQIFDKEFVTRIDYTINPKHHLYGRYFLDGYQAPSFFSPTNILLATPAPGNYERVQSATIGEDFTITSHLVNSSHITVLRRVDLRSSAPGINACSLGITVFCAVPTGFQSAVTSKFSTYCGTCAPGHYNDNSLSIADDVTYLHGKHQFVFGGEYVRNQLNIVGAFQSNGSWTISGLYSGTGLSGGSALGDADLDFLQGATSAYSQSKQQQNALRAPIPSLYFQDTFHATKRLTMVAGIRWAPQYMPVDYFNRGSTFSMAGFLAGTVSTVYPNAPAGTSFYGDPGVSRQFTKNSPWQFSPNVGLTFDPVGDGKTVIRAGSELIYDEVNFFTGQRVNQNPPFATASAPNTSGEICFSNPWLVGGSGNGCKQVGGTNVSPYPQPAIPTPSQALFPVQGQFIVLPTQFHPSYTIQYTVSVQHDFPKGWQVQLDYIGNGTRHAPLGTAFDPAVFVPGVWGAGGTGCAGVVLSGPAAKGKTAGAAGSNCSTTGNTSQRYLLTQLVPGTTSGQDHGGNQYLGGGGGSVLVGDSATANYNGLITSVNHRLSSTLSVLANWTWSKCLNIADGQGDLAGTTIENPNRSHLDYGPCGADYRHIENFVVVAKSEFGFSNRIERYILNNWEVAPRVGIQTGSPQNVTSGQDNSLTAVNNDRPNLVPGVPIYLSTKYYQASGQGNRGHINPAAFAQVTSACATPISAATCSALGTYGNVSRDAFRSPPSFTMDAQISRIFPIHESLAATFRLEGFNVLNHPNFGGGGGAITSATFGQVSFPTNARVFQGSVKLSF